MTEPPFTDYAIPRRAPAEVVPAYAFEAAIDIINGLTTEYQALATAYAEAVPAVAKAVGTHFAEVLEGLRTAMQEIGAPPR